MTYIVCARSRIISVLPPWKQPGRNTRLAQIDLHAEQSRCTLARLAPILLQVRVVLSLGIYSSVHFALRFAGRLRVCVSRESVIYKPCMTDIFDVRMRITDETVFYARALRIIWKRTRMLRSRPTIRMPR